MKRFVKTLDDPNRDTTNSYGANRVTADPNIFVNTFVFSPKRSVSIRDVIGLHESLYEDL